MVDAQNEMLLKDFIESNWSAWLTHCRENDISEQEAEKICNDLTS